MALRYPGATFRVSFIQCLCPSLKNRDLVFSEHRVKAPTFSQSVSAKQVKLSESYENKHW